MTRHPDVAAFNAVQRHQGSSNELCRTVTQGVMSKVSGPPSQHILNTPRAQNIQMHRCDIGHPMGHIDVLWAFRIADAYEGRWAQPCRSVNRGRHRIVFESPHQGHAQFHGSGL